MPAKLIFSTAQSVCKKPNVGQDVTTNSRTTIIIL